MCHVLVLYGARPPRRDFRFPQNGAAREGRRMKHGRHFRKLGKDASHRWAMMRTMVTQLIEHERIQTTVAKAKELRRVADRVVTFAKEGSLRARRKAAAVVRTDAAVNKLFTELAERYKERPGGFTRVLQIGQRKSDSAAMAYIEYVDRDGELRPARPATGFGLSWAAKEYVNSQLASKKRHGDVRAVLSPAADAAAKAAAEPPKEEK